MSDSESSIAGLLLAAGSSSRLGRPKQLVEIGGIPLVRRAALTALQSGCDRVFVVLGANRNCVAEAIADLNVDMVDNPEWPEGIASSLRAGVARIDGSSPRYDAVLMMLADQIRLVPHDLNRLIKAFKKHHEIAASEYADTLGVPALFPRRYFGELRRLSGDTGAKSLLLKYSARAIRIPCLQALEDLDTRSDLKKCWLD